MCVSLSDIPEESHTRQEIVIKRVTPDERKPEKWNIHTIEIIVTKYTVSAFIHSFIHTYPAGKITVFIKLLVKAYSPIDPITLR